MYLKATDILFRVQRVSVPLPYLIKSLPVNFFESEPKKLAQIYPRYTFVDKRCEDKLE